MSGTIQKIWVKGGWRDPDPVDTFSAIDPATGQALPDVYPVSAWSDCDAALSAAADAFIALQQMPGERFAVFLEKYATALESRTDVIAAMAHAETALPLSPRLRDVEMSRTVDQLRQAAQAARNQMWREATIDQKLNIRSCYEPIGPVFVIGPNNFPLAFNAIAGGDFAAAIAAGNPVIAKAHPLHPGTTRLLAEAADEAIATADMPPATVQLLYHMAPESGLRMVSDHRLGATAYTGSRQSGLQLKAAADAAGKPIYLEMSSINPVVILHGAIAQRSEVIAEEFSNSCLMGCGQFCTNPGVVIVPASENTERFIDAVVQRFAAAPAGILLGRTVAESLAASVNKLCGAGAELLTGQKTPHARDTRCMPTLLRITGDQLLDDPETWQTEMFGPASLIVVADSTVQVLAITEKLEGNLAGSVYHAGLDDRESYLVIEPVLRRKVGRLLNNKMPTGVAVSPAMNHGGPYPATGHPGFTAVGFPASIPRFAVRRCFDNVDEVYLPAILRRGTST